MAKKISELPAASALTGDELVEVSQGDPLASKKVTVSELRGTSAEASDFTGFYPGKPAASAIVMRVPVGRAFTFPADMASSKGLAVAGATASATFSLKKNGTQFATMVFAAGAATATFTASPATSFAVGDILEISAPATQDATLADVGFYLKGDR